MENLSIIFAAPFICIFIAIFLTKPIVKLMSALSNLLDRRFHNLEEDWKLAITTSVFTLIVYFLSIAIGFFVKAME